jgi:hypothetical protein
VGPKADLVLKPEINFFTITRTNRFVLFREIIVYSENRETPYNCIGQNIVFMNVNTI